MRDGKGFRTLLNILVKNLPDVFECAFNETHFLKELALARLSKENRKVDSLKI
jgi:hypothetical protein